MYIYMSDHVSYVTVAAVDIRSHRMILWDLGGQEDLQQLWDKVTYITTQILSSAVAMRPNCGFIFSTFLKFV